MWAGSSRVQNARCSNRLLAAPERRLASGRRSRGRVRARSRRWSSRASSGGGLETSSLAVASAELAAGGRVVAAVSVPVGSGWAAYGAADAARSPSVGASSPGPAISGGGGGPSSLNPARSRLAGPSRELAAVEGMAGLTWSDQETYELIRIWAADRDLLDGTSRNNKVYESMAAQMRSLGYLRTALQVKEKMKRLRKEYKYGKRSKKIATYHDALATVLAQGSKGGSLFIKSEVDESMGSEEFAGTDSETNYMEDGPGCSAPPAEGNGNDERAQGFFRGGSAAGSTGGGGAQGLDYSRSPGSPPVECATALRFPADNFPTITTTTAEPGDGARFPAAGAGGPRAALKRKLPDAPSPPTLAASTLTDLITRGIDKFVELEHKRMRLELDLLERLRHEELERLERMRREEMDHELRLMSVLASLFNNNNSTSSVNLNSSSSEPPAGS
ncbi:uncharacterized protein [Dermacentor albipictus]|uniref:uncharacterized protein isoform X2 n=1 Tax=Dermacentor albipictus TaxID=60249 RepID=UPI0038FCFAF7